jgi:tRNA(Ile)-lysidine synthase
MIKGISHLDVDENMLNILLSALSEQNANIKIDTLYVGYSGGVDSHVLLDLLYRLKLQGKITINIEAIHVNHGISPQSDKWQKHCENICEGYGITFRGHKVDVTLYQGGLEETARQARYNVFLQYTTAHSLLLLGHHQDDQIETFFMRALRGSGLVGLSGIPKSRKIGGGEILRPLLLVTKEKLMSYAHRYKLQWVEDDSNKNVLISRNWWRNTLLPQIWQRFPSQKKSVLHTIEHIQTQHQLIQELLTPYVIQLSAREKNEGRNWPWEARSLSVEGLIVHSVTLKLNILRKWVNDQTELVLNQFQLQGLLNICCATKMDSSLYEVKAFSKQVLTFFRYKKRLYMIDLAHYEHSYNVDITKMMLIPPQESLNKKITLLENSFCTIKMKGSLWLNRPVHYQLTTVKQLSPQEIEMEIKSKNRPTKTVKKLFQEHGVPSLLRPHWPVIHNGSRLISLVGLASQKEEADGSLLFECQ